MLGAVFVFESVFFYSFDKSIFEKMNGEKVYQIKLTANKNKFVYNCVCGGFILPC